MVKRIFSLGLAFSIIFSMGTAFASPKFKPGKWEITTETEMVGMPMKMPPQTHTQCLTGEEFVPQNKQPGNECQISDVKTDGNTVTWKITCSTQGGQMEGSGRITYSNDTFNGTMDMVMKASGMGIKNKISGRRVGDCD